MSNSYFLQSMNIAGFRAYLQPKEFNFTTKRCLAIFAPNGHGKSSLIDSIEFMFSKDGTLERLGQRSVNNQAGPIALAHYLAEESKITPMITISVISNKIVSSGSRPASGTKRAIPDVAITLNKCFVVPPIIRGHALRAFVETHTPEQRYSDVASWLQLSPLVEVQKNIRALRTQIKSSAEDETALNRLDAQVSRETAQIVRTWDLTAILAHINTFVLAPLDTTLQLAELTVTDTNYIELAARVKAEESKIGLASLRHRYKATAALWAEVTDTETNETVEQGAAPAFNKAVELLSAAETKESDERSKAANNVFQELWKAAELVFAEGATELETCPVCTTPVVDTIAGNTATIRDHISKHLEELADYAAAKKEFDNAKIAATKAQTHLVAVLAALISLEEDDESELKTSLVAYQTNINDWSLGKVPVLPDIATEIAKRLIALNQAITEIESKQGDHTYAKAKTNIDRMIELQSERNIEILRREELEKIFNVLTAQATTISTEIRKKLQALLNKLQAPMNEIYRQIQGDGAIPIRLELPPEEEANQQRLNLLIDFAENRTGVQPGGYLSDSQLHSVALALRLAAIKQFNPTAPIIALDDVVTSYDADHRRNIAGLIATMFDHCQIILTTHDERFFNYLKDQLAPKAWHFTRIIGIDPAHGPRFADHKVSDEMIAARWKEGQLAANEIRQAEEEWLLGVCREFGVSIRIRPLDRAYAYERSELASALASLLKDIKLVPALVTGVNNRFLDSLVKGEIENFGSHFQEGPYGDGSIGDEKTRWEEFKTFRKQFACKKCNRTKFQRPFTLKKPICAHEGCETQFEFAAT